MRRLGTLLAGGRRRRRVLRRARRRPAAAAHPLGNFSISHLDTLTFHPDRIVDEAVIDTAEIPTAQAAPTVDTERRRHGLRRRAARPTATRSAPTFAGDVTAEVDGAPVTFAVTSSSFALGAGQAGLDTSRLECRLEAPADLTVPRTVRFVDDYLPDRVGWHEINADR